MAIGRSYWVHDMASFADEVDVYDGLHYYVWTGTIPSWFNVEPFYPGATEHYPTFTFTTRKDFPIISVSALRNTRTQGYSLKLVLLSFSFKHGTIQSGHLRKDAIRLTLHGLTRREVGSLICLLVSNRHSKTRELIQHTSILLARNAFTERTRFIKARLSQREK